jgi:hypothetical protein
MTGLDRCRRGRSGASAVNQGSQGQQAGTKPESPITGAPEDAKPSTPHPRPPNDEASQTNDARPSTAHSTARAARPRASRHWLPAPRRRNDKNDQAEGRGPPATRTTPPQRQERPSRGPRAIGRPFRSAVTMRAGRRGRYRYAQLWRERDQDGDGSGGRSSGGALCARGPPRGLAPPLPRARSGAKPSSGCLSARTYASRPSFSSGWVPWLRTHRASFILG